MFTRARRQMQRRHLEERPAGLAYPTLVFPGGGFCAFSDAPAFLFTMCVFFPGLHAVKLHFLAFGVEVGG